MNASKDREYGYEREKGRKYSHSKDPYREKVGRWTQNQEVVYRVIIDNNLSTVLAISINIVSTHAIEIC